MNDLEQLMRDSVADPPPEHLDLDGLVAAGRGRVRARRAWAASGGAAVLVAGVVAAATFVLPGADPGPGPAVADRPPAPAAPTITLADATRAVEGTDYRVLTTYTNENLDADNGQYYDGVTDDGLVLFRDGPRDPDWKARFALLDPATGDEDRLPDPGLGQDQVWPVHLGTDRLVLLAYDMADEAGTGFEATLVAHVYDRAARTWSTMRWPGLPDVGDLAAQVGSDGRLYVATPVTRPGPPPGGWPTGPGGEAEDADAEGETNRLWSVSLTDATDVRDEGMDVGSFAFTDDDLVWTDSTGGAAGLVHVRDLGTGQETSFDPNTGDRCNLLSFGASGDRIVLSQYCGTYDGPVRDDRVQILSTSGEQVATLQDDGVEGYLTGGLVNITAYSGDRAGTYVYDLATDRLLRLSDGVSSYGLGGPVPDGMVLWHTPVNHRRGAEQWLGELLG